MPRNRTKYQSKREHELSPGEILDACGPSDAAIQRAQRLGPTKQEKKQRRRSLELVDRFRRIGRMVRAFRRATQPPPSPPARALGAKKRQPYVRKQPNTQGAA